MKPKEIVVDLVKVAFIVLIIKVMATTSVLMPWNTLIDNMCIVFAIFVMLAKFCKLTFRLYKLIGLAILSLISLYTCVSMGQYDLLVTVVTICLLINEDLEEYIALMLKVQIWFLAINAAVAGFLSLVGMEEYFWIWTDQRLRFTGGLRHPNVLSCYITSCMMMFAWLRFRHITVNEFGWMICVTVLSFGMSRSRAGLLLNLLLLLLIFLTQNESRLVKQLINPALLLSFAGLTAVIYWATKQYASGNSTALMLDEMMTGRIKYAAYAYLRSGMTLLPRYLDYAQTGVVSWTPEWNLNNFTFDNFYSFLFMQMGMIWIGIIALLLVLVCKKFDFRNKLFILFWLLFATVEVLGLNCFKFFPLLLFSTLLSGKKAKFPPRRSL